jgi:hypothetical protein
MADSLSSTGKNLAMNGIKAGISGATLRDASNTPVITNLTVASTDFTVGLTGTLSNSSAIDFTVDAGDIGTTITKVTLEDSSNDELIFIDLDTAVELTTAGTATFAIGDLTADL